MRSRALVVLTLLLSPLAAACGGASSPPAAAPTPSAQESPASSLPARWWAWSESSPAPANPIDDPTGRFCAANQPDDVWFLAGTHGGAVRRTCHIPSGRPVYFPVLNQICVVPSTSTAARALAACSAKPDLARASLDGKPVPVRAGTSGGVFTFTARPSSSTGFMPGAQPAVTWGVWVGPLTIPDGEHTLSFKGVAGTFSTSATYRLTVGG